MVFERLAGHHDREGFSCGVEELDDYFRKYARQNAQKGVAAVFVLVPKRGSGTVLGFYTLSATVIDAGKLPREFLKKLPKYQQLPATLIGRLARRADVGRKGIGEKILVNALRRSAKSSETIGSLAVVVDAKSETAKRWYLKYGFLELKEHPGRLYLPMESIEDGLRAEADKKKPGKKKRRRPAPSRRSAKRVTT